MTFVRQRQKFYQLLVLVKAVGLQAEIFRLSEDWRLDIAPL